MKVNKSARYLFKRAVIKCGHERYGKRMAENQSHLDPKVKKPSQT